MDDDMAFVQGSIDQAEANRNNHYQFKQLIASWNNEMHKPPENITQEKQHRNDQKKSAEKCASFSDPMDPDDQGLHVSPFGFDALKTTTN